MCLSGRLETIKKELGSQSKIVDDDIERRLNQGIRHREAEQLVREIEKYDIDKEKKRVAEEEFEASSLGGCPSSRSAFS